MVFSLSPVLATLRSKILTMEVPCVPLYSRRSSQRIVSSDAPLLIRRPGKRCHDRPARDGIFYLHSISNRKDMRI